MFWVVVIGGFLLFLFFSTKKEEVDKIKSQGGLYLKYQGLIDHFLSIPGIKVEQKNNSSVILAVKDKFAVTRFTIGHGFEDVSVFWNHHSTRYGKHSLNWTFPESLPQSQMIHTIEKELGVYERNLMSNGF